MPKVVTAELDPGRGGQVFARTRGDCLELYPTALIDGLLDAHHGEQQPHQPIQGAMS